MKSKKLTITQIQQFWNEYKNGLPIATIAQREGYNRYSITKLFRDYYGDLFPVQESRKVIKLVMREILAKQYQDGMTLKQLSNRYDVSVRTINQYLLDLKIEIRPVGRAKNKI
jgi:AraC-like DNA-binding protein